MGGRQDLNGGYSWFKSLCFLFQGVGRDQAAMCDHIVSMTLVDGQGCKKTLDSADELLAGKTSLGVLGVVLEYTVEVQEMSFCRVQNIFEMRLKVCLCSCQLSASGNRDTNVCAQNSQKFGTTMPIFGKPHPILPVHFAE
jgi:hypothetical protein